jgi:hypothetical protein
MHHNLKYKLLKQKAQQEPDADALQIIKDMEKQHQALLEQMKVILKEEGKVKAAQFIQHKLDYSKLESKFAGWVYRELQA